MVIGCCVNCKYLDLINDKTECSCLRCSGKMISLGVSSDEWNRLNDEEMMVRINTAISSYQLNDEEKADEVIEAISESIDNEEQLVDSSDYEKPTDAVVETRSFPEATNSIDFKDENGNQNSVGQSVESVFATRVSEPQENATLANSSIPSVKKKSSPIDAPQGNTGVQSQSGSVPTVRKKAASVNSKKVSGTYQMPTQSSISKGSYPIATGSSPFAFVVVSIIVAVMLVVVALITSSSIGGIAAIISVVVSMSTTFMNGYDIFENTHTAIRYVVWGTSIVISILGIIL